MPDAPHDTPSASVAGARWADALASSHRASDALAGAAASFGRLDQALASHPLRPAFLYRARLEAVRQQAAVDGEAIDPWHLAALLEGLRLRMDHGLRIIDRGLIFAAGRHALTLHQWLTEPDCDQEGEVRRAEAALAGHAERMTPLLAGARACHAWLDQGGERAPMRAALVRLWVRHRVLRTPVPLTGTAALRAETDWEPKSWVPAFLTALAGEAEDARQLLSDLERAWFAARRAVAGRRRHSRAAAAIDIMAATPLVSATSLAAGLGMAVKNAAALLDGFCQAGLAVEVTHRSKRRLFGLAGLAPLRDGVAAPRRPEPGRGRGRPPAMPADADLPPPAPSVPLGPLERREFDYSGLAEAMAFADETIRRARQNLAALHSRAPAKAAGRIVPAEPVLAEMRATAPASGASGRRRKRWRCKPPRQRHVVLDDQRPHRTLFRRLPSGHRTMTGIDRHFG